MDEELERDEFDNLMIQEDGNGLTVTVNGETERGDFLEMSDEELFKTPASQTYEEPDVQEITNLDLEGNDEQETTPETGELEETSETEESVDAEDPTENVPEAVNNDDEEPEVQEPTEETPEAAKGTDESAPVNKELADFQSQVLAPLKGNGEEVQLKSIDELRQLASMGMNYTKKMQSLAPLRRVGKMLEDNGLLDEDKLSYLIDLDKKNPAAIAKLVQESGIDTLELDEDKAAEYKPNTYSVDEKSIALDSVIEDLSHTEHFKTTADIVKTKWDEASKQAIYDDPQILVDLNNQVASGVYDRVMSEVNRVKMLGGLVGMNTKDSYLAVGQQMYQQGQLNDLIGVQPKEEPQPSPKPAKADPAKVAQQKKAVAQPKGKAKAAAKKDFNPLALSDDEFAKIANMNYS